MPRRAAVYSPASDRVSRARGAPISASAMVRPESKALWASNALKTHAKISIDSRLISTYTYCHVISFETKKGAPVPFVAVRPPIFLLFFAVFRGYLTSYFLSTGTRVWSPPFHTLMNASISAAGIEGAMKSPCNASQPI